MEAKTENQMQPLSRKVCGEIDEHERAAASEAKNDRHMKWPYILTFGEVFKTSLTPGTLSTYALPSFSHFVAHGRPSISKAHATPTNSNAHVSPVGSKVIDMCVRHTLRICIPSHVIWTINIQQRRTLQQSRTSHRSAWESENCAQHQLQAPASQVYTRQQQGSP